MVCQQFDWEADDLPGVRGGDAVDPPAGGDGGIAGAGFGATTVNLQCDY